MKNYKIIDVEATIHEKGNPHSELNRLCIYGIGSRGSYNSYPIEYSLDHPYGPILLDIKEQLQQTKLLVGINVKYDLGWGYYYGLEVPDDVLIWDCSIAHYIFTGQTHTYPSMNDLCEIHGIPPKEDKIAKYWEDGIDTPDINLTELIEYNINDLKRTEHIFFSQLKQIPKSLWPLIFNSGKDSQVTAEMEYNGIKYDVEKSKKRGEELTETIQQLDRDLSELVGDLRINWNSGDHISAVLYGGVVKFTEKEDYEFFYADSRKGSRTKSRTVERKVIFPQLVKPLPRSELKKAGYYSTDVKTLSMLKATGKVKKIISLLIKRSALEKEVSTYFFGIPKLIELMAWPDNYIHPQFNHTRTLTSRLSGTKPNPQNIPDSVRECLISRFGLKTQN